MLMPRETAVLSAIRNIRTRVPDGPAGIGSALLLPPKMMFKEFPHSALALLAYCTLVVFRRETAFAGQTRAVPGHRQYPEMHCRYDGLNPNPIIDCRPDALTRSEILLGGLNRDVAQQKLDLIQFAACTPTEPGTGSSQIVRRECRNTCF